MFSMCVMTMTHRLLLSHEAQRQTATSVNRSIDDKIKFENTEEIPFAFDHSRDSKQTNQCRFCCEVPCVLVKNGFHSDMAMKATHLEKKFEHDWERRFHLFTCCKTRITGIPNGYLPHCVIAETDDFFPNNKQYTYGYPLLGPSWLEIITLSYIWISISPIEET